MSTEFHCASLNCLYNVCCISAIRMPFQRFMYTRLGVLLFIHSIAHIKPGHALSEYLDGVMDSTCTFVRKARRRVMQVFSVCRILKNHWFFIHIAALIQVLSHSHNLNF